MVSWCAELDAMKRRTRPPEDERREQAHGRTLFFLRHGAGANVLRKALKLHIFGRVSGRNWAVFPCPRVDSLSGPASTVQQMS